MVVVHLVAGREVILGTHALTQQHADRKRAHRCLDHLHTLAGIGLEDGKQMINLRRVQQIGFVDDNHVGAGDLVFKQFRQRRFVIKIVILRALGIHGGNVMGKTTVSDRLAVNHRHHAINGDLR